MNIWFVTSYNEYFNSKSLPVISCLIRPCINSIFGICKEINFMLDFFKKPRHASNEMFMFQAQNRYKVDFYRYTKLNFEKYAQRYTRSILFWKQVSYKITY